MLDNCTHIICRNQANAFALSAERGLDSRIFVEALMNSESAARLDSLYDPIQWKGPEWILTELDKELKKRGIALPQGETLNPDAMHWMGYMYRYWQSARDVSSRELIGKFGFDRMADVSWPFHTVSFEMALERIEELCAPDSAKKSPKQENRPKIGGVPK